MVDRNNKEIKEEHSTDFLCVIPDNLTLELYRVIQNEWYKKKT
jgi:hypothetical protein